MTTTQTAQLTCELKTNLIREDVSPYDFGFEVTCIAEPSEENGPERRMVGLLTGFTYFPGRLTRKSDIGDLYDLCDSRADYLLDGYSLLRNSQRAVARAVTGGTALSLKGLRGVVFCERLIVNPAARGNGLGLRLLREVSHMFALSQGMLMMKALPDSLTEEEDGSAGFTNYLLSDTKLALGEVRSLTTPGWLAGLCRRDRPEDVEEAYVTVPVNGTIADYDGLSLDV